MRLFPVTSIANAIPVKRLDDVITIDATPDTYRFGRWRCSLCNAGSGRICTAADITSILQSVVICDPDDQGIGIDLIFFNANTTLGTENSAPDADDTEAQTIVGRVQIGSGSFYDIGASRIACVYGIGLPMKAGTGGSIWMAGIARGAPTYAGGHLYIKLGRFEELGGIMALTYKQIREIAVNQDHIATVCVALVKASLDVYAELATAPNHANRLTLAHSVLLSPESHAHLFIWAVAFTAVSTTDAAILTAVKAVWDYYAGIG